MMTANSLTRSWRSALCGVVLGWSVCFQSASLQAQAEGSVRVDDKTERVINRGLKYLIKYQSPDGSWQGRTEKERHYPIAITAYALMAFQAAGHLPGEGEYGRQVSMGVRYLLNSISPEGLIGDKDNGQYMYFHGVATIALAELYGQTSSPVIRSKLESLIKIIVSSQHQNGGWRYKPIASDADISVTVLQVVALRAAKNGGLKVPQTTIDDAVDYVRSCYNKEQGGFSYQPGSEAGFARTAAAIYSLQVCGHYNDPLVKKGSKYLFEHFKEGQQWFTYGNFYAAPAQYMLGGETWKNWYSKINTLLLERVDNDGEVSLWYQNSSVGPIYETSVNVMILAMPYQYIPLYQR
jgi:squalene cyclase